MRQQSQLRVYAAVLAFATAVFAALAGAVLFLETADRVDVRFVSWVHATAPDALVDVLRVLTYAGSPVTLGTLTILIGLQFVRRGSPGAALFVVAAFAGSQVIDLGLKAVFRRGRPELEDPVVQLSTFAFPSGHAFGATATYGALALILASEVSDRRRRAALLMGAAALILVVGASRVILGAHYLLDVSAGIAGGVALLCALLLALQCARSVRLHLVLFSEHEQRQRTGLDQASHSSSDSSRKTHAFRARRPKIRPPTVRPSPNVPSVNAPMAMNFRHSESRRQWPIASSSSTESGSPRRCFRTAPPARSPR